MKLKLDADADSEEKDIGRKYLLSVRAELLTVNQAKRKRKRKRRILLGKYCMIVASVVSTKINK